MPADLTIVIVSWNSKDYLQGCLASLPAACNRHRHAVVVVDNGSTDGSAELLRKEYPEVAVLRNTENRGFAAANNLALRSLETPYVVLLNPDTVVSPGAFDAMIDYLDAHPDVWVAGPRMRNGDGSDQRTGVRFPTIWILVCETFALDRLFPRTHLFGRQRELYADPSVAREVEYQQGSCLMARSEAVRNVGLLDERFFMYFEETDWCYRMRGQGGKVMYVPVGDVVHFGGSSDAHYGEQKILYYYASHLRLYRKYRTAPQCAILRVFLVVRSLVRMAGWSVVRVMRPSAADIARSSIRGYWRSLGLLFRPVA